MIEVGVTACYSHYSVTLELQPFWETAKSYLHLSSSEHHTGARQDTSGRRRRRYKRTANSRTCLQRDVTTNGGNHAGCYQRHGHVLNQVLSCVSCVYVVWFLEYSSDPLL